MKKKTNYFITLLIAFSGMIWTHALNAQQVSLLASDDAYVDQANPDLPAEHNSNIFVSKGTDTTEVISYVKFDVSKFANQVLLSAEFSTRSDMVDDSTMTIAIKAAKNMNFSRDTTTWNNKPGSTGKELASVVLDMESNRKYYVPSGTNLIDYINGQLINGATEIGFELRYKSGAKNSFKWMGGKGDGAWGPQLDLVFSGNTVYYPIDDAYVDEANPDSVAQHNSNIFVSRATDTTEMRAYIKFELPGWAHKQVGTVNLSTRSDMNDGKTMTVAVRGTKNTNFSRETTTWKNKPGLESADLATVILDENSDRKTYVPVENNFSDFINGKLAQGIEEFGIALIYKSGDSADFKWMGGKGDGAWGPMLEVTEADQYNTFAIDDAVAELYYPDSTVDHNSNIFISKTDTNQRIAFVKFDISSLSGRQVSAVEFSTRSDMQDDSTMTVALMGSGNKFTRDTTTWNNKPNLGDTLATVVLDMESNRKTYLPIENRLIDYVNGKLQSGANELALAITYADGAGGSFKWMGGKGDGTWGPQLILSFSDAFTSFAIADAVAEQHSPDEIFDGHGSNIFISKTDTSEQISFVKFDISSAAGKVVSAVEFSTRSDMNDGKTMTVALKGSGNGFQRDTTTWNNKPSTGDELATVLLDEDSGRKIYVPTDTKLTDYVNNKLVLGENEISFALVYKSGDGGDFKWMGGKGDGSWGPQLELVFEGSTALPAKSPVFTPATGTYIPGVTVQMSSVTPNSGVFYTLDGTTPDSSSTEYTEPVVLTAASKIDTIKIKAIAYAKGWLASEIDSITYVLKPISEPEFITFPGTYQDAITIEIKVPIGSDNATIYYTDGDGAPNTPYPVGGITYDQEGTYNLKVVAFTNDGLYQTETITGAFTIKFTTPGPGTGPAGVGYKNYDITGQPVNNLWLKADDLSGELSEGDMVLEWPDNSGNDNNVIGTETQTPKPDNYHKEIEPAPIFLEDGINGMPAVHFGGAQADSSIKTGALHLDDPGAQFDDINGMNIFMVFKRNGQNDAHSAFFEKRDFFDKSNDSWVFQFNGNSSNQLMLTINANSEHTYSETTGMQTDEIHIVNAERDGLNKRSSIYLDGAINTSAGAEYGDRIPASDCPLIIGNGDKITIAELVFFSQEINTPQRNIIFEYLASKYDIPLMMGDVDIQKYKSEMYKYDVIGIGKDEYFFDETVIQEHLASKGAGLILQTLSLAAGDYIFAGHDGTEPGENMSVRKWNIDEQTSSPANVTVGFDFAAVGLSAPGSAEGFKLLKDGEDLGLTPTLTDGILQFAVEGLEDGVYSLGYEVGISDKSNFANADMLVYPNPVYDKLNIEIDNNVKGEFDVTVRDLAGKTVLSEQHNKSGNYYKLQIDLTEIEAGYYIVEVKNAGRKISSKPIIVR